MASRFDSLLRSGYHEQRFSHSLLSGTYGLLLSPGRGIFIYVPMLLAAIAVVPRLRSRDRVLGILAITLLVARVLFFARWWSWYGGDVWGPRFLVPVLPAFAPSLAAALERWPRSPSFTAAKAAGGALAIVGLWVTLNPRHNAYVAPQIRPGSASEVMRQVTSAEYVSQTDHAMFDWSRFPFDR
jgi:hypothetical protein